MKKPKKQPSKKSKNNKPVKIGRKKEFTPIRDKIPRKSLSMSGFNGPTHAVITDIDRDWFKEVFKRKHLTQVKVAGLLGWHESAMSLLMGGKRRLSASEAVQLAKAIGEPLDVVLIKAGGGDGPLAQISHDDVLEVLGADPSTTIKLKGILNSALILELKAVKSPNIVPGVILKGSGVHADDISAVRIESKGSKFQVLDGAIVYFKDLESGKIAGDAIGRLSMVKISSGEILFRVLERGYSKNKWSLTEFGGITSHQEVDVVCAEPVLWLKM